MLTIGNPSSSFFLVSNNICIYLFMSFTLVVVVGHNIVCTMSWVDISLILGCRSSYLDRKQFLLNIRVPQMGGESPFTPKSSFQSGQQAKCVRYGKARIPYECCIFSSHQFITITPNFNCTQKLFITSKADKLHKSPSKQIWLV